MGDEFNMSMPGEQQIGLPGNQHLARQIQEAGVEMHIWEVVAGAAINVVGSLIGGNKSASAARKSAQMSNEAAQRQLEYDTKAWDMSKDKLRANREFAVKEVEQRAKNEGKVAAFKDASNLERYNYDMMIRNREQTSLNQQYLRSDDIYNQQITLNALTARAGRENEFRKLQEIGAEAAFDAEEQRIQRLKAQGTAYARGVSGKTTGKIAQSIDADLGRKMAMINESLASAGRNTKAILQEIARDKTSADLAALAQKMLDPGVLPTPIVPFKTPMAEFLYPREIEEFDFGPKPVLGAIKDPGAAANQVWGTTISGIAGTVGNALGSLDLGW